MKFLIYITSIVLCTLNFSCSQRSNNLNVAIRDSNNSYNFKAEYPDSKTEKLEKYLDSALNNKLSLDKHLDVVITIQNGEKISLKSEPGNLEINFNKAGSTASGYLQVKRIAEGANKLLTQK
ncbi:hypothetical protein [Pedobacter nototheniae]|uniref:hypothetical protein n=1 Tax=Pedobacter nototheniae TaxID=2488994 RepID=UPI00103FB55C|nr:hypothetical protein [Pedobacter nototheniae]